MSKVICGVLRKKRKFYFTFNEDTKILIIQPVKMNEYLSIIGDVDFKKISISREKMNISGETNSRYYIEFIDVRFVSIGRGCFEAWVPAYVIGKDNALSSIPRPINIKNISFKGDCIDRFMSSKSMASSDWDYKNQKLQVNIDYGEDKIKRFNYNDLEFSLVPGWIMPSAQKNVKTLLNMQTSLKIEAEKTMNLEEIINLYKKMEKFFAFLCYRKHVEFESIILSQIVKVKFDKEPRDTVIEFELHVSSDNGTYDLPKIGKSITLDNYTNYMPLLIKSLEEDDYIILSLPDNSLDVNIIDNNRFIAISSSFESEFDLTYPNFKSNKNQNYKKAKKETINFLLKESNNRNNNSTTRKYYKNFINYLEKIEGSLEEQLSHVFQVYSYIVKEDQDYYKKEYPNINFDNEYLAKAFADKRNNLSHGNKLESFKILEMVSYLVVRKINYAMILDRAGFNKEEIKNIINKIF